MKHRVTVMIDDKKIRVRHFPTRKKAEQYEKDQYKHNLQSSLYNFVIEEIKGDK